MNKKSKPISPGDAVAWFMLALLLFAFIFFALTSCHSTQKYTAPIESNYDAVEPMVKIGHFENYDAHDPYVFEPTIRPDTFRFSGTNDCRILIINDTPKECDHFFVSQAYTIEGLMQQANDWRPCACIHCGKIEICKK